MMMLLLIIIEAVTKSIICICIISLLLSFAIQLILSFRLTFTSAIITIFTIYI